MGETEDNKWTLDNLMKLPTGTPSETAEQTSYKELHIAFDAHYGLYSVRYPDGDTLAGSLTEDEANAIAHCLNSYARNCGLNATECAEADLLGGALRVIEALLNTRGEPLTGKQAQDKSIANITAEELLAKAAGKE